MDVLGIAGVTVGVMGVLGPIAYQRVQTQRVFKRIRSEKENKYKNLYGTWYRYYFGFIDSESNYEAFAGRCNFYAATLTIHPKLHVDNGTEYRRPDGFLQFRCSPNKESSFTYDGWLRVVNNRIYAYYIGSQPPENVLSIYNYPDSVGPYTCIYGAKAFLAFDGEDKYKQGCNIEILSKTELTAEDVRDRLSDKFKLDPFSFGYIATEGTRF